jgi:hypothetical protein
MKKEDILITILFLILPVYFMSVSAIAIDVAKRTNHKGLMASSIISLIASIVFIVLNLTIRLNLSGYGTQTLGSNKKIVISLLLICMLIIACTAIYAAVVSFGLTEADIAKDAKVRLFNNSIAVAFIIILVLVFSHIIG